MFYSGFFCAIAASVFWGLTYVISDRLLSGISSFQFLLLTSILALIVIAPFMALDVAGSRGLWAYFKAHSVLLVVGVSCAMIANVLILQSIKLLGASTASVLEITYPFFVMLFLWLFFGVPLTLHFALGALLIFAGSFVIIWWR